MLRESMMNTQEYQTWLFFRKDYDPEVADVFHYLYHWSLLDQHEHKSGNWFHKEAQQTAKDLSLTQIAVERAYDIINKGQCPLFQSDIKVKDNHPTTYFKLSDQSDDILNNILTYNNTYIEPLQSSNEQIETKPINIPICDSSAMLEMWNSIIRPYKPETLTSSKKQQCLKTLAQHFDSDLDKWRAYCIKIRQSNTLMSDKSVLSLSLALKPEWMKKVQEGIYDNQTKHSDTSSKVPVYLPLITLKDVLSGCKSEIDHKVKPVLFEKLGAETYGSSNLCQLLW